MQSVNHNRAGPYSTLFIPLDMYVNTEQDFEGNPHLKNLSIEFLEDIVCTPTLLPAEHKAASQLLRSLSSL